MTIAYFTDIFLPSINGIVTSLMNLSTGLAKRGNHILIFAPKPSGTGRITWSAEGVSLVLLPSLPSFIYPDFRIASPFSPSLIEQMHRFPPDVIHLHSSFLIGGGAILLGKVLKKPVVGSFHGYFMEPEYLKIVGLNGNMQLVTQALWKFAVSFYNQCDHIVSPSHVTKKDLLAHGVHKPVTVIPHTIDQEMVQKVDQNSVLRLRRRWGLPEKVLLYVGRLSREKCLDTLFKAVAGVMRSQTDVGLLIIGDGPIKNELQQLAESLRIAPRVVFTGEIAPKRLLTSGYYQLADVFITASTSEVLGVTLIEAMYFGLPLIGVARRGVGETIEGVGLTVSPENPDALAKGIARILTDEALRIRLCTQSHHTFASRYSSNRVVTAYERMYRAL